MLRLTGATLLFKESSFSSDPNQPKPAYLPVSSFKKELKRLPKDPTDVAADFLGAIYNHALAIIESAGVRDYFNFCQKEFILTVPAVWSDKAKDLTLKVRLVSGRRYNLHLLTRTFYLQAAKKAGIHPVTLIKEPEAAALYTLSTHDHSLDVSSLDLFNRCMYYLLTAVTGRGLICGLRCWGRHRRPDYIRSHQDKALSSVGRACAWLW